MEERLAQRIRLFQETGQVSAEVAEFVSGELDALSAEGLRVSEETAGMLTSHLLLALTRLLEGGALAASPLEGRVTAELADEPEALARAGALAERAEAVLGAALPDPEVGFLALHLAVLRRRSPPVAEGPEARPAR
ncbi:PRD domain-containing protein [Streptomyces sp. AJS327]|uniref:PRD domain-containing protein n=1 Tax=Streptomyces sp. AJS327 TaxID=2545265 RepID=UPI0015DFA73C|nr:PRD domain-containing protein [Streptomyces sp. AJS327]MBA0051809.1 PRD domain-containing protein [Streptomyces sp. AJS327]